MNDKHVESIGSEGTAFDYVAEAEPALRRAARNLRDENEELKKEIDRLKRQVRKLERELEQYQDPPKAQVKLLKGRKVS